MVAPREAALQRAIRMPSSTADIPRPRLKREENSDSSFATQTSYLKNLRYEPSCMEASRDSSTSFVQSSHFGEVELASFGKKLISWRRLLQLHPGAGVVFVDEFNAGYLKRVPDNNRRCMTGHLNV